MPSSYDKNSPESILIYAKLLERRKLKEVKNEFVDGNIFDFKDDVPSAKAKGIIGRFYEAYFGLPPDQEAEPDFREAHIELKSVPIIRGKTKIRIKERTKITSLNYMTILNETWPTSHVKKKTNLVLFIFYEYLPGLSRKEFMTVSVFLWKPTSIDEQFFSADWKTVWNKVNEGLAHKLSEGLTKYLGACTSGSGQSKPQPKSPEKAKERSFALKPAFTRYLLETRKDQFDSESLAVSLHIKDVRNFDDIILQRLHSFEGQTMKSLAEKFHIRSTAKQYKSMVTRRCLGQEGSWQLAELEKQGIEIRTVPMKASTQNPSQATSFPAMDLYDLLEGEWETSDLKETTTKVLFIPVWNKEQKDHGGFRVGKAFFWSPTPEQENIMKQEWERCRELIRTGKPEQLPTANTTRIIHVRPHARDGKDKKFAPGGALIIKRWFWLNAKFVGSLVRDHL